MLPQNSDSHLIPESGFAEQIAAVDPLNAVPIALAGISMLLLGYSVKSEKGDLWELNLN